MFRISKTADYGVIVLTHLMDWDLATETPKPVIRTAREISKRSGLPMPMVSKILKALAKQDVLTSHRGVKGGYSLARAAAQISVADIITALDGPIAMTSCLVEDVDDCEHEANCPVRSKWHGISQFIMHTLRDINLEEMIEGPTPGASKKKSDSEMEAA